MALHTELPIYKTGTDLLQLAFNVQAQLPRQVRRSLGETIVDHCVEILNLMAMANASKRDARAKHIEALLVRHNALTSLLRVGFNAKWISHGLWGASVQLLQSIGAQAGGWLKYANRAPAA